MSDESGLAYQEAKAAYQAARGEAGLSGQDPAAVPADALLEAASAHVAEAAAEGRPLAIVQAEYEAEVAVLAIPGQAELADREAIAALGQELSSLRSAQANLEGNLPGGGHAASVGIGD